MTGSQALVISILFGMVTLVIIGIIAVILFPPASFTPPTATVPTATPLPTATATFPNFLPTPSQATPVITPTATNTRLPTLTPSPVRSATPTVVLEINLPEPKATATVPAPATPAPAAPTQPAAPADPAGTPLPLQYNIVFNARNPSIRAGDCTFLEWRVEGANIIRLDGQSVPPSGREEVCPEREVTYQLAVQLPDGNSVNRSATVFVRE